MHCLLSILSALVPGNLRSSYEGFQFPSSVFRFTNDNFSEKFSVPSNYILGVVHLAELEFLR